MHGGRGGASDCLFSSPRTISTRRRYTAAMYTVPAAVSLLRLPYYIAAADLSSPIHTFSSILFLFAILFYARQLYRQVLLRARISYGNSVCPSVRLSQPGGIPSSGEIETPGLHHMVA